MKVVHLIDSGGVYGAEKMLLALCAEQRRLGLDALVLSARLPAEKGRDIDIELRNADIPVISWPMRAGLSLREMYEINAWAVENQVDVMHAHGYKFNVLVASTRGRARIKMVTTVHGYTCVNIFSRLMVYDVLDRLSYFAFDRVVYVSPTQEQGWLARVVRRSCIPNGVDIRSLPIRGARGRERDGSTGTRLIAVGRLSAEKDYKLLLDAVSLLKKQHAGVTLSIFGEGPEEAALRRIIVGERLEGVKLEGYSNDIVTELCSHDVLVVSSKTEGMPISIMEAMCVGLRIAATAVGGVPLLLKDYPLAKLVTSRSADELACAIRGHFGDSRSLGEAELARVRERLSSATMARRYVKLYEGLLEFPRRDNGAIT